MGRVGAPVVGEAHRAYPESELPQWLVGRAANGYAAAHRCSKDSSVDAQALVRA